MRNAICAVGLLVFLQVVCAERCLHKGYECPNYEVIKKKADYEERRYEPSVWVSTTTNISEIAGSRPIDEYMKLFRYIKGQNSLGAMILRTVPVRVALDGLRKTVTTSFYLPSYLHANPPKPTDESLVISREPAKTYIARQFGGATAEGFANEKKTLLDALEGRDDFDSDKVYEVVYDRPDRPLATQRNEVWFELKEKK